MKKRLLDMLFPERCPLCHDIPVMKEQRACPVCVKKVLYIREPSCKKCGRQLAETSVEEYCENCKGANHIFDENAAVFLYDHILRNSISTFKYKNARYYVDWYAEQMDDRLRTLVNHWSPQAIIPVPLYKRKEAVRGFNQAALLAEALSRLWGIPVFKDALKRPKKTNPQKELSAAARKHNVIRAFRAQVNLKMINRALLVDDIYTTGSTLDACALVLKETGVKQVFSVVIAASKI